MYNEEIFQCPLCEGSMRWVQTEFSVDKKKKVSAFQLLKYTRDVDNILLVCNKCPYSIRKSFLDNDVLKQRSHMKNPREHLKSAWVPGCPGNRSSRLAVEWQGL